MREDIAELVTAPERTALLIIDMQNDSDPPQATAAERKDRAASS